MLPSSLWQYCAVCVLLTSAHASNVSIDMHHKDHMGYTVPNFVYVSVLFDVSYGRRAVCCNKRREDGNVL